MVVCAVPGCGNNSDATSNYTFHPVPKSLMSRARWIIALGPMLSTARVCSRHFEASMFKKCGDTMKLVHKAVPTLFLDPSQIEEASHFTEVFDDETVGEESADEVVACRVCLAVDGRLSAVSSTMEDTLAALTGVAMPEAGRWPRHLCVFCVAKLSKCAAFRDSCRRSAALLRTLAERGPLKMNDIKAIDRRSYQLTNNLACHKVFEFNSDPLIEVKPTIKIERVDSLDGNDNECTEVSYVNDDFVNVPNAEQALEIVVEKQESVKQEKGKKCEKTKMNAKIESRDGQSNTDDEESISEDIGDDFDSETSEETVKVRKKIELIKKIPNKTVKSPRIDMKAFEERYNVEYKFMSKEEQVKEIEDRKIGNKLKYCCDMCGRGYNREQAMVNHMWTHDPSVGPFECGVCRQRFPFSHKLLGHSRRHRDRFLCRECGLVSRDSTRVKSHFKEHEGGSHACPYCSEAYVRKASYFNHIRTAHPERNEACDECGETFLSALGVRQHKRLAHRPIDEAALKCKDCGVKFLNAEALQKHLDLSYLEPAHAALWACAACGDSCGSEAGLQAHAQDKHPPDQHHCNECKKTFRDASSFALHVERKHRGMRTSVGVFRRKLRCKDRASRTLYICEMCGWKTMVAKQLERHRNSHLGIKPFPCTVCDKKFPTKHALKIHILVHTGERPFQCKQCPQAFTSPSNLWRHKQNVHMRVQATCKYCGKSMGASSLPLHVRTIHLNQPLPPRKRDRKTENRRKRSPDS